MNSTFASEFNLERLPAAVREFRPEWGIVLGSGLGPFLDQLTPDEVVPFADIPGLPAATVAGHAGRFVFAEIGGKRVVIAAGRVHLYEGFSAREVTAGVRCLSGLGITKLLLTNAAGSLNPAFAPGQWMMLTDHLNLTGTSPLLGGADFFDMSVVYSESLRRHFGAVAASENIVLREGVYAGVLGPQYETPAEVRMLARLGADAVGMSTVLEAIQARALNLEVAGFSCLTNWASGLSPNELNHDEVLAAGSATVETAVRLLTEGIRQS